MIDVPIEPYDQTHTAIHVHVMYDSTHEAVILLMQLSSTADSDQELAAVDEICGTSVYLPHIKNINDPLIAECERAARLELNAKFGTAWTALVHFARKHGLTLR